MSAELFIVWLQGYLAATGGTLTAEQIAVITTELNSVQMRGPYRRNASTPAVTQG
jgi:hypothetical protein